MRSPSPDSIEGPQGPHRVASVAHFDPLDGCVRDHFDSQRDALVAGADDISHHDFVHRRGRRIFEDIGVAVEPPAAAGERRAHVEVHPGPGGPEVMALAQALEQAVSREFFGVEAGQTPVRAERRRARVARARPALVSVAVAHHAAAMTEREPVGEQPLEGAPRGVDLHRRLDAPVVGVGGVGVAPADVGVGHAVLAGEPLEQEIGVGRVRVQVRAVGQERVRGAEDGAVLRSGSRRCGRRPPRCCPTTRSRGGSRTRRPRCTPRSGSGDRPRRRC